MCVCVLVFLSGAFYKHPQREQSLALMRQNVTVWGDKWIELWLRLGLGNPQWMELFVMSSQGCLHVYVCLRVCLCVFKTLNANYICYMQLNVMQKHFCTCRCLGVFIHFFGFLSDYIYIRYKDSNTHIWTSGCMKGAFPWAYQRERGRDRVCAQSFLPNRCSSAFQSVPVKPLDYITENTLIT